eukprot:3391372-Amphidinium_carterae.2
MPALASIGYQFIEAFKLRGSVTGVTFFHQVHDRAMSLKCRCAMASMLEGFVLSDLRKVDKEDAGVVPEMRVCCLECGCALHDLHNSLKWAYQSLWLESGTPLTNLVIGSNCYKASLVMLLVAWDSGAATCTSRRACPMFSSEGACCSYRLSLSEVNSLDRFMHLLISLWRFEASCGSRWLTMGAAARRVLTLSRMSGFHALYAHMRKQGVLSEWEASGADKVGEVEVEMCAVLSLVGRSQAAMQALFSWLEHLSSSFWSLLAAFLSLPPSLFRDKVIRGALVSMCYVQVKIFDVAVDHPWSLAVGVIPCGPKTP